MLIYADEPAFSVGVVLVVEQPVSGERRHGASRLCGGVMAGPADTALGASSLQENACPSSSSSSPSSPPN